jgi:hypothetical protein
LHVRKSFKIAKIKRHLERHHTALNDKDVTFFAAKLSELKEVEGFMQLKVTMKSYWK